MTNFKNYSDNELLNLLAKGNNSALEEIFNRYWSQLYSSAYKRIKIREVAEEVVQDLFTSLWVKRESIHITTSLSAYLFTSVRYLVLNHIQKEVVRRNYQDTLRLSKIDSDNSTEELVLLNDLNSQLDKEISNLPTKCRSIFELSRKMYKTNKEIALLLGISEKTVENHLTKAIRRLRVNLNYILVVILTFIS